ncbi:MAG: methyl-accepting chemotaxis protein [Actinobacteria bacterium]|nr:MAG: methyl-accepting chemotaxis protein [Actinomycetota bacterium]
MDEVRDSTVKGGLSARFTILTWVTIAPAVGIGLGLTAAFAAWTLHLRFGEMLPVMLIGAVLMCVCGVPGTLWWRWAFKREVLRPLRDLGAVMVTAGRGDLRARAAVGRRDEIGILAEECNALIGSLAGIASNVRRSAESVSAAAAELSASSQEINSSTIEISSSVQQIAHGAELQSRKVEETSSAVEGITRSMNDVAMQALESAQVSEAAAKATEKGEEATAEAVVKIREVKAAIDTLSESVDLLGRRSEQIGDIVDVITSIADQTNLLSLNAAIEAARAGESGRGFSVVAEEVRKLAEGSGKAAEQIGELIKEVQAETAKAVRFMEIGAREVAVGTDVVDKTGEVLREISSSVSRTAILAEAIAKAVQDQAGRGASLDKAIHDIAAVVEENAASAEETAAAAEQQTACMEEISSAAQELADMSRRLEDSVHQFQVD